ncbi:VOC family protein [Gymnodinialimonas sp.]
MTSDANPALDYLEFTSPDVEATQAFFTEAFGWSYIDYGPDYKDIQGAGLGGGIERGALRAPLPVVRTDDLEAMLDRVKAAGAEITQEIFAFPGGRRFQFKEPGGTEMAVWTTVDTDG